MALSDRELRLLAEMEQALSADDPALVSTLSGTRRRGPGAAIGDRKSTRLNSSH